MASRGALPAAGRRQDRAPALAHRDAAQTGSGPERRRAGSEGSSGLSGLGERVREPKTDEVVAATIAAFASAAGHAKQRGFDGWSRTGHMATSSTDSWWTAATCATMPMGRAFRRARFACEFIKAVRVVVWPAFPDPAAPSPSRWKLQDYRHRRPRVAGSCPPVARATRGACLDALQGRKRAWRAFDDVYARPKRGGCDLAVAGPWLGTGTGGPLAVGPIRQGHAGFPNALGFSRATFSLVIARSCFRLNIENSFRV